MRTLNVKTSAGQYSVRIGFTNLDDELNRHQFLLMDSSVANLRALQHTPKSFDYRASEKTKNIGTCEEVLIKMCQSGFSKEDTLLAIGGGATQDIATFCASIYMRGVGWTYAPTTAMSMFDSCVGGKSSINLGEVKNLVGNVYPPTEVIVDLSFMSTQNSVAIVSGLSEAAKICFAAGTQSFDQFLLFNMGPDDFIASTKIDESVSFVMHVLESKRFFIEVDEFDKAERRLLNFGHTFAHALESASNYAIPHGIAVGLGVIAALKHPKAAITDQTQFLEHYLKRNLSKFPEIVNLARTEINWDSFKKLVGNDKKASRERIRLILPAASGGLKIVEEPRTEGTFLTLQQCMTEALSVVCV